jgi:hypothetical protein
MLISEMDNNNNNNNNNNKFCRLFAQNLSKLQSQFGIRQNFASSNLLTPRLNFVNLPVVLNGVRSPKLSVNT